MGLTAEELTNCLAKCAELTSRNTKLAQRLHEEKEANKLYQKQQEDLQKELGTRTDEKMELQHALRQYQHQTTTPSFMQETFIAGGSMESNLQSKTRDENGITMAVNSVKDANLSDRSSDDLREQLASREQENLALVHSLCTIKEKCAQMEANHQRELRTKTAEHAEAMENYMSTVNETLSHIESNKQHLEDVNMKLRTNLQQLEEERMRHDLEHSKRSSKGTNTDGLESATYTREKENLQARVLDLELQLARERKLTEMVEQNQKLEHQHEEQHESTAMMEATKAKQEYKVHCKALNVWRNNLQLEFEEYQAVERASQQESDRRIDFLSACIEEFVRLADTGPSTTGRKVSTNELYDIIMGFARDSPRVASGGIAASPPIKRQTQQRLASREKETDGNDQQCAISQSNSLVMGEEGVQDEAEMSEAMWWKLRASKMEAYVRSATLQNDTFEDTIRQLELGINSVKDELATRLAREAQLETKISALKTELVTTKDQAASLAEKYQLAQAELQKHQGVATSRGDETQRARMTIQRKAELLIQQKAKVASLQQELEQATKKIERLGAAEKQAALLQQKAKEHTQQLLHARQSYELCHHDNVQLSFHLEKVKERHADVVARLKAVRKENGQLRAQHSDLNNNVKVAASQADIDESGKNIRRDNQGEASTSIAYLTEEARALKRRVLQKQDVIVSYKSKVAGYEAQLERQRETMIKLARTNRELQQGYRHRQQQEHDYTSALQAKLEDQLEIKQAQLDGLRASVYDSFEAFVFCRAPSALKSPSSPVSASLSNSLLDDVPDNSDRLYEIKRWTDFSTDDIEDLKLARGTQRTLQREDQHGSSKIDKNMAATAALRNVENALETNPGDCRADICKLLQCMCT
ncbi:unnamed protein product [Phytophthora fragariaefolia]|uniref:Unnamed protein product n=1 Tax=Phytophthora fragariaefolia TaxID=1490495 RepID=A0A9W7CT69_9STRA|nr:unnamed protein product [Phytophthora fragariaefolia]